MRLRSPGHRPPILQIAAACLVTMLAGSRAVADDKVIDYNRDVRPILTDRCFACHGPDEAHREAGLRFDTAEGLAADLADGIKLIDPGKPDESELIFRVEVDDDTLRMPPPESEKSALTAEEIDILRRWVEQGGEWSRHWAYDPPVQRELPEVQDVAWPRNAIDRFILARLEAEGLHPQEEVNKAALIRRVTLDLTGLPPTPEEVDAFLADDAPDAYESVVDRLLESPRFGEQMARTWLDVARYGDTHGLHLDNYREMWPYRDWVIDAYNRNMPFDQFLTWQLAGDLLPEATLDQKIASGFNRAHVSTSEGGSIAEEVFVRNVTDRVDTTSTVFLGLTVSCARCHDHKYDPITIKDYYGLFAVFNNLDDNPLDGNAQAWPPIVKIPSPEQVVALASFDEQIASIRETITAELAKAEYDPSADANEGEYVRRQGYLWIDDALPSGAKPSDGSDWQFVSAPEHPVHTGDRSIRRSADGQTQNVFTDAEPKLRVGNGDTLFAHVFLDPVDPPKAVMLQFRAGEWKHRAYWGENLIDYGKDGTTERLRIGDLPRAGAWVRLEVPVGQLGLKPGTMIDGWAFTQHGGTAYWDTAGIDTWTPQDSQTTFDSLTAYVRHLKAVAAAGIGGQAPKPILEIAKLDRKARDEAQATKLREHFLRHAYSGTQSVFEPLESRLAEVQQQRKALDGQIPTTLISQEKPEPKPAFVLNRGEYDQPTDPVARAVPAFLATGDEDDPNRLDFARWLLEPEHPLTSRVAVNRFWQQFFGTGLVKTSEDFGMQGEPPSHPELLDWMAVQFREDGWDVKVFLKRLVTSATYRQSSRLTPEGLAKDPANRLLARGPRYRLDAELLRDQALFLGDLLVEKVGGPSVKPPQPPGVWEAVGYTGSNTAIFKADTGVEKVHRRSLYTFWKRTAAPPQMTTFDAPSREECTVRRERTNTPLQALLLMNDPQYVEAARALAQRSMREDGSAAESRIATLFRRASAREPRPEELAELTAAYHDFLDVYSADDEAARDLIGIGETKPDPSLDPADLAATTMVASIVLNLDEVITKE